MKKIFKLLPIIFGSCILILFSVSSCSPSSGDSTPTWQFGNIYIRSYNNHSNIYSTKYIDDEYWNNFLVCHKDGKYWWNATLLNFDSSNSRVNITSSGIPGDYTGFRLIANTQTGAIVGDTSTISMDWQYQSETGHIEFETTVVA